MLHAAKGRFSSCPRSFSLACLTLVAIGTLGHARAAEISSSPLKPGSEIDLIVISGEISPGDAQKFRQVALGDKSAIVLLNSNGGSTLEAIEIGKLIRIAGYPTYVSSYAPCNSACSLIWLAGNRRFLGSTASVGFHATYTEDNGKRMESGVGNAIVGSYLNQLSLDENAIIFATSAPPDQISSLTIHNLSKSGIGAEEVKDTEAKDSSSSSGNISREYGSVGGWKIYVDDSLGNGCFASGGYDDGLAIRLGYDARNSLSFYIMLVSNAWKSITSGTTYSAALQLDSNDPWSGNFMGIDTEGSKGLYINVPRNEFLSELSKAKAFRLYYKGRQIDNGQLPDIGSVVNSLQECQSRQTLQSDPFSQ